MEEKQGCCKTRDVLWYLVFFGFAVNTALRLNMNIAIVSMVKPREAGNQSVIIHSECFQENNNLTTRISHDQYSTTTLAYDDSISEISARTRNASPTFEWDEEIQGIILGSYFYFNGITQLPGGILATKYGTKILFGVGNFLGVLLNFFIPSCAYLGYKYVIAIRVAQGFVTGVTWPSMHNMVAKWIPPHERSKFVSSYMGSAIGVGITYSLCGLIIDLWGWEVSFHVFGTLGTIWFIFWWFLVYDTPAQHPRISESEREYIMNSLGNTVTKRKNLPVPWCKIITSVPLLVNIFAQFGGLWGMFTLMNHSPAYLKFVFGKTATSVGFASGIPNVLKVGIAIGFSYLADYMLKNNKMSVTNIRKLATAISTFGQGIFVLALSFCGCNYLAAVTLMTVALLLHGTNTTGPMASMIDIAPNFASVSLGIANTVAAAVGALAASTVGYLTYENNTSEQWQKVFWICTAILFMSSIFYQIFSSSEVQEWNFPKENHVESPGPEESLIAENTEYKTYNGTDVAAENVKDTKLNVEK